MKYTGFAFLLCCLFIVCGCKKNNEVPVRPETPRRVRGVNNLSKTFNDMHKKHIDAAKKFGVKPVACRDEAEHLTKTLKEIGNNDLYIVDKLTYSVPFLVPRADELLTKIAQNFKDSLNSKWLHPHKLIVTSVLRTKDDVKKLKKVNINASENSAHMYGTTFDITWKRFKIIEKKGDYETLETNEDKLKHVLAEVLRDLQKENRCYVKHEKNQACFHITTR